MRQADGSQFTNVVAKSKPNNAHAPKQRAGWIIKTADLIRQIIEAECANICPNADFRPFFHRAHGVDPRLLRDH